MIGAEILLMQPSNPRLESLPHGETLLTWEMNVSLGGEARTHQLRFAVRLNLTEVDRLITAVGCERAVYLLWTYFWDLASTHASIDSDRVSLQEWTRAVDALLTAIQDQPSVQNLGQDAHRA